ncbi:MAG: hypothetical protein LBR81_06995 [Prevotellaceae bacterium]|nr:hypothetical protein [Prevotellaceae bacterium]
MPHTPSLRGNRIRHCKEGTTTQSRRASSLRGGTTKQSQYREWIASYLAMTGTRAPCRHSKEERRRNCDAPRHSEEGTTTQSLRTSSLRGGTTKQSQYREWIASYLAMTGTRTSCRHSKEERRSNRDAPRHCEEERRSNLEKSHIRHCKEERRSNLIRDSKIASFLAMTGTRTPCRHCDREERAGSNLSTRMDCGVTRS